MHLVGSPTQIKLYFIFWSLIHFIQLINARKMEHIKSSLFDKRKVYGEDEMKNFPWILKLWDKEISIFW